MSDGGKPDASDIWERYQRVEMVLIEQGALEEHAQQAVVTLLEHIGEDPGRNGLKDTPRRVVKALLEMTRGYQADVATILGVTFDVTFDEMVVLTDIPFNSLCEHHMLPFTGTATVGYIPGPAGGVVGISKLARLVEAHAQRLQIQERMTDDIAKDLNHYLYPKGVGVVIQAHHQCMSCRGVRLPNTTMTTSALTGAMKDEPEARAEFLAFTR
tara:strand:- start:6654 stop:7292 length:639 start_codon:yes stop_codon:yes gene_type:complete